MGRQAINVTPNHYTPSVNSPQFSLYTRLGWPQKHFRSTDAEINLCPCQDSNSSSTVVETIVYVLYCLLYHWQSKTKIIFHQSMPVCSKDKKCRLMTFTLTPLYKECMQVFCYLSTFKTNAQWHLGNNLLTCTKKVVNVMNCSDYQLWPCSIHLCLLLHFWKCVFSTYTYENYLYYNCQAHARNWLILWMNEWNYIHLPLIHSVTLYYFTTLCKIN